MPIELLWVIVVFGVNFALWGFAGSLRFAEGVWRRRAPGVPSAAADGRPVTVRDVAVLIPAHNEEAVLARSLESIARLVPSSNIYVVSDASTDRTVAIATDHGVSVIETAGKAGKAGALEEGIRRFRLVERYDAVLLLDADTQLDPDYFESALPLFDDPGIVAVAGCAHTDWNPPGVSLAGRILITHRARIYAIMQHLIKFGQTWRRTNALYIVPGFASMYRTRVLPHIDINPPGLVIEDFNMTFELYRRRLGRVGFTPRARAVTQDPGTFGDYVRQTKRWSLGFWQAVRRYRPRAGLFPAMLVLFVTELLVASALIVLLPVVIILSVLPTVIPGLLETPLFGLVHAQVDLRLVLLAVLVPDLVLTISVAVLERRPRYLLFAPAFLPLRMVDAAIALYALPRAWAERSTGSWVSPRRRHVVTPGAVRLITDDVRVIPVGIFPGPPRYAAGVDATTVSGVGPTDHTRQPEHSPRWAYTAGAGTGGEGGQPGAVARIAARVPVRHVVGDRRDVEPAHAVDHPAPIAVPARVKGRASVRTTGPGHRSSPVRVISGVVLGRVAAQVVDRLGADTRCAVGLRGATVISAEAVEHVVALAAGQVPGVRYAHTDVSPLAAAVVQQHGSHDARTVSTGSTAGITEVRVDLCVEYGFAVRTVAQRVRGAVVFALRDLLDVEAGAVDIVVRGICPAEHEPPHGHAA